MKISPFAKMMEVRWVVSLVALLTVLIVACGSASQPADQSAPQEPTATIAPQAIPAATQAPSQGQAAPTSVPQPTAVPQMAVSSRDSAVVVTEAEPGSVGAWSTGCSAEIHSMGCQEFVTDFLTWLDDRTSQMVNLSGTEG